MKVKDWIGQRVSVLKKFELPKWLQKVLTHLNIFEKQAEESQKVESELDLESGPHLQGIMGGAFGDAFQANAFQTNAFQTTGGGGGGAGGNGSFAIPNLYRRSNRGVSRW
jgi:hypothetical protein